MNLLDKVKKLRGAEEALGLTFADSDCTGESLPKGARLLAYSNKTYFCFFKHYEETVFAVTEEDRKWKIYPIAFSFLEFLRLIAACGSAELCARAKLLSEAQFLAEKDARWRRYDPGLKALRDALELAPVEDPYRYIHTITQIIDCSRIGRK